MTKATKPKSWAELAKHPDIFAIQDRVNKYYVTTVKTIEQAKFYILYNLGERK